MNKLLSFRNAWFLLRSRLTIDYTQHMHIRIQESLIIVVYFYIIASLKGPFP